MANAKLVSHILIKMKQERLAERASVHFCNFLQRMESAKTAQNILTRTSLARHVSLILVLPIKFCRRMANVQLVKNIHIQMKLERYA